MAITSHGNIFLCSLTAAKTAFHPALNSDAGPRAGDLLSLLVWGEVGRVKMIEDDKTLKSPNACATPLSLQFQDE
jgi:hypothetical protein